MLPKGDGMREQVTELAMGLISLASWCHELQVQAHLIHFNYEGSNFLPVHAFLKERYEEHLQQMDHLGELVRTMDYWMPLCSCGLGEALQGEFQMAASYTGAEMLVTYLRNVERLGEMAKAMEPKAQAVQAVDVANTLADLVGEAYQVAWFIKAQLR